MFIKKAGHKIQRINMFAGDSMMEQMLVDLS